MTAPHCAPTRSCIVMPTVHPSRVACATIWSVVCVALGRRIFGIASISATVANIFMPMGVVRRRSSALRSSVMAFQS